MNITQEQLDEAQRKEYLINREEVLNVIKNHFNDIHASLKIRSTYDQTIIGNIITCLEMDLKNDVKKVKVK